MIELTKEVTELINDYNLTKMIARLRREKARSFQNILSRSTSSEAQQINYSNILFLDFIICLQL